METAEEVIARRAAEAGGRVRRYAAGVVLAASMVRVRVAVGCAAARARLPWVVRPPR